MGRWFTLLEQNAREWTGMLRWKLSFFFRILFMLLNGLLIALVRYVWGALVALIEI